VEAEIAKAKVSRRVSFIGLSAQELDKAVCLTNMYVYLVHDRQRVNVKQATESATKIGFDIGV
jgi:hypothetical protein